MTKDESTCPIPAKKAKSDETDDRIEDEQSKLDEELLLAAKECFILYIYRPTGTSSDRPRYWPGSVEMKHGKGK